MDVATNNGVSLISQFPLVQALSDVELNGNEGRARCPAHQDDKPSLSLGVGDKGALLVYCHAGCTAEDVYRAAGFTSTSCLHLPRRRNGKPRSKIVATYQYQNAEGRDVCQKVRWNPKGFAQRRRTQDGKNWVWTLGNHLCRRNSNGDWRKLRDGETPSAQDRKFGTVKPGLYKLPEVLAADQSEPVLIVEGEKDVDKLWPGGFVATCNFDGASDGKSKWKKGYSEQLRGRDIVIIPDNDPAGISHAESIAEQSHGLARSIKILKLPVTNPGDDVTDWIDAGGLPSQLRKLIADCPEWQPAASDGRPCVPVTTDEYEVTLQAENALAENDEELFQRGGQIVAIREDPTTKSVRRRQGSPRISPISQATLRERLSKSVRFVDEHKEDVDRHVPEWVVRAIHSRGSYLGLRPLHGLTSCPIFRPDGSIHSEPGYDEMTGLLHVGSRLDIPEHPTPADAIAATQRVLRLVHDFPFDTVTSEDGRVLNAHKSAWLAGLLTPLASPAIHGPNPLFAFDANVAGSGKTLLATLAGIPATGGHDLPRMSWSPFDEELRKRITSVVMGGDPIVLIDNVDTELGSGTLDAAITGTTWKDRLLGRNEMVSLPLNVVWFVTGNNLVLRGDLHRRVIHCRLCPTQQRPEERSGFQIPNIQRHVAERRSEVLLDAFTLLRAFAVAGFPDQNLKPFGSFEAWSRIVRNAIYWVGCDDPCESRQSLEGMTAENPAIAFLTALKAFFDVAPKSGWMTAGEILAELDRMPETGSNLIYDALIEAMADACRVTPGRKLPTPKSFGWTLRRMKDRTVDGVGTLRCDTSANSNRWKFEQ